MHPVLTVKSDPDQEAQGRQQITAIGKPMLYFTRLFVNGTEVDVSATTPLDDDFTVCFKDSFRYVRKRTAPKSSSKVTMILPVAFKWDLGPSISVSSFGKRVPFVIPTSPR